MLDRDWLEVLKFYSGKFEYPEGSGTWYQGNHEPMITEAQFNQIQVRLGKRGQYTLQNHETVFWLRQLRKLTVRIRMSMQI